MLADKISRWSGPSTLIGNTLYALQVEITSIGQQLGFKFLADLPVQMTLDMSQEFERVAEEISALSRRQVGLGTLTDLRGPLVAACAQVRAR